MPTTKIELAGKERELSYDFSQVRKLKKQFKFRDYEELIKTLQPEDYLAVALIEGADDKEGLTAAGLDKELKGPDAERAFVAFCTAFFPPRVIDMLEAGETMRLAALKKIDAEAKQMEELADRTNPPTS